MSEAHKPQSPVAPPAITIYSKQDGLRFAAEIFLLRRMEKERILQEKTKEKSLPDN